MKFVFEHQNLLLYLVSVFTTTSSVYLLKRGGKLDLESNHDTEGVVAVMGEKKKGEIKTVKISDDELSQQTKQLFEGLK